MAQCNYCDYEPLSTNAKFCPRCGEPDPAEPTYTSSTPSSSHEKLVMTVAFAPGVVIGLYFGFMWHGVGGALLGGIAGIFATVLVGALIQGFIEYVLPWIIVLSLIRGIVWVFQQLWDLGKP